VLISISVVLLLGLLIWFLLRIRYLRWAEVLLCTVFGFLLASTAAEPLVQATLDAVAGALGQVRP